MGIQIAYLRRLSLLIQRLLDAELLQEEDSAALLARTEVARKSLEAGDAETARQNIEQVALFTEALVQSGSLSLTNGQAVLQVANALLNPPPDAGSAPC